MVETAVNPLKRLRARALQLFNKPLESLEPEDFKVLAGYAHHDPIFFCKYFLPEFFSGRVPWLHYGVMAVLTRKCDFLTDYKYLPKILENFVYERDGVNIPMFQVVEGRVRMNLERFTLLMLPRGFSKTTYAGIAFPLYNIVYGELDFACYISETATHAQTQLDNIKKQIEGNERIKKFFGELKPGMQDPQRWRQDEFETTTGMAMVARGRGGQVRGLNKDGKRPKLIIFDDVEDKESVATPEQRAKTRSWAYGDVMPALPALDPQAAIIGLGTPLHPEALLMTFLRDPEWSVVKIECYDKSGELTWPENMDEEKLRRLQASAVVSGTLGEFFMERRLEIRASIDRDFKREYIQYGAPYEDEQVMRSLYVDPAISDKKRADHCTFTVAGLTKRGRHYFFESDGGIGMKPSDMVDKIFALYAQYRPEFVGIESNAFQAALVHLVREEQFKRKLYFEVIPVTHTKEKFARIKGILQPRYAQGRVWHTRQFTRLEQQLLEFPETAKDDYADGAAGAISLLDPAAPLAEDTPDEVPPLEEVIGGSWRFAV